MTKEQFLRGAVSSLSATKKELAELKASIPQTKHDAIVKMQRASNAVVTTNCRCNSLNDHDAFAYKYAKSLLTAKGTDNA